jgi:hypothetical protein
MENLINFLENLNQPIKIEIGKLKIQNHNISSASHRNSKENWIFLVMYGVLCLKKLNNFKKRELKHGKAISKKITFF